MKIRLGLALDGQHGWHTKNSLGEITVGTSGMLNILEMQLGLVAEETPLSQRVVQYLDCLKKSNHPKRFYHQSLHHDELGTSATLLNWRDQWYLHGWNGKINSTNHSRLQDLADVELLTQGKLALSEGERLAAVFIAMQKRALQISEVILTNPISSFPLRWQQVLLKLPTSVSPLESPSDANLFLSKLQMRLLRAHADEVFDEGYTKLPYHDDGSVLFVSAETKLLASRWFAEYLGHGIDDGLLVASDGAAILDEMLAATGYARHGLNGNSAYRPALQLLPMTLAMLWAPIDFNVLIAFLSHPISPVRSYARRQIAAKIADEPGLGGARWEKVLKDIDEYYGEDAPLVRAQILNWIDHSRFNQALGVPIEVVLQRTLNLKKFFQNGLHDPDTTKRLSWNAGYAQTSAFVKALQQLQQSGAQLIKPQQLQKLLKQVTSRGSANGKLLAEVGSLNVVKDPAAIIETFKEIIWWQPVMPSTPKSYPWSISEQKILAESGVQLPEITDSLALLAFDWLKPILAAQEKLIVILPPKEAEVHPIWQMLEAHISGLVVHSLEKILSGEKLNVVPEPLTYRALPKLKRWWHLPDDTPIPKRHTESFSSLESYLFNPYQWLLRYPAELKASNILSVSDGFLLQGKLAHRIVERFFALPAALSMREPEIEGWFNTTYPEVVAEEGAVLLMDGRHADYEDLRYCLKRALITLMRQFKASAITSVESEMRLNGHYAGGEIKGFADLVLTNQQGKTAVLDMKWGGRKKYSEKLSKNSHLQLAIYAELLRQKLGVWPDVAYYILVEAKLIAQHDEFFPDGNKVKKSVHESTSHLWERFKNSYAWRKALLQAGEIEVVLTQDNATEASNPPDEALATELLNAQYNEFINLAGWR